jgi:hypothetical protein
MCSKRLHWLQRQILPSLYMLCNGKVLRTADLRPGEHRRRILMQTYHPPRPQSYSGGYKSPKQYHEFEQHSTVAVACLTYHDTSRANVIKRYAIC